MQHKLDTVGRLVAAIAIVLIAVNVYWAVSLLFRPLELNLIAVLIGVFLQAGGVSLGLGRGADAARRRSSGVLFLMLIIFGAVVEWQGLFNGHNMWVKGRGSPSVWGER